MTSGFPTFRMAMHFLLFPDPITMAVKLGRIHPCSFAIAYSLITSLETIWR